jgi:hypothetical protein
MSQIENILAQISAKTNERLKLQAQANKLDEEAKALSDQLTKLGAKTGSYGAYFLTATTKKVPVAQDWPSFWSYIRENNAFELLHKRVTEKAAMERINAGESIPGVSTADKVSYTITGG